MYLNIIALFPLLAACISSLLGIRSIRKDRDLRHLISALLFFSITLYTLGYMLELSTTELNVALLFIRIEYIGISLGPPLWLFLLLMYSGRGRSISFWTLPLVFAIPAITILIMLSGDLDPVFYTMITMVQGVFFPVIHTTPGPWWWVTLGYNFSLLLVGLLLLIIVFPRSTGLYRSKFIILIIGSSAPVIAIVLNLTEIKPIPDLDLAPFALLVSAISLYLFMGKEWFPDLIPIAHTAILDALTVGVIVLDHEDQIRELNPAARVLLGAPGNDFFGKHISSIFPYCNSYCHFEPGDEHLKEIIIKTSNHERVCLAECISLNSITTKLTGKVLLLSDITDRVQADAKEKTRTAQITTLLDTIPGFAFSKDLTARYITANKAYCDRFRLTREELAGKQITDLLNPEEAAVFLNAEHEIFEGIKSSVEINEKSVLNGREVIINSRLVPYHDEKGSVAGIIGLEFDVTQKNEEEKQLKKYADIIIERNEELEKLKKELQDMNDHLDTQVRERTHEVEILLAQKDQFIQQLAHDLRTPLIPLVGLVPFLVEQEQDPDLVKLLVHMQTSVEALRDVVEKILHLARLISQHAISERYVFTIKSLAEKAIEEHKEKIIQKKMHVSIEIADDLTVSLSPAHANTILHHLVGNAIRFTDVQGSITISARQEDDNVCIFVKDNGIGIREEDLERIFDEFYLSDPARQSLE